MWRVVPASVIGTSHEKAGLPCQDACGFLRFKCGDEDFLLAAVADGAGSAALSHVGSFEAVNHLLATVSREILALPEITKDQMRKWMQDVLTHLASVAERENTTQAELACTLLFALVGNSEAIFAQIGDGGWVVEKDGGVIPATWPQNGEYANVTTFITTDGALEAMQFERLNGKILAVAGFTDGLQTLALNFLSRTAHAPFFKPMFDAINSCDDETSLIAPLHSFLVSEAVVFRTDDDKTLVLACRCETESN